MEYRWSAGEAEVQNRSRAHFSPRPGTTHRDGPRRAQPEDQPPGRLQAVVERLDGAAKRPAGAVVAVRELRAQDAKRRRVAGAGPDQRSIWLAIEGPRPTCPGTLVSHTAAARGEPLSKAWERPRRAWRARAAAEPGLGFRRAGPGRPGR
jgi:hypothetical protein